MTQTTHRVVITGLGIVSCLGNDLNSVSTALQTGRSGITQQADLSNKGCAATLEADRILILMGELIVKHAALWGTVPRMLILPWSRQC